MIHRRNVLKGLALAAVPRVAWGQAQATTTLHMIHGSGLASFDPIWTTAPATNDVGMMVMNHLHPPFDNPAVRQALAMAVDQDDHVRAASGGQTDLSGHFASFYMCGTRYASDAGGGVPSTRGVDSALRPSRMSGAGR